MMMLNGLSDLCVLIVMLCLAVGSADVKTCKIHFLLKFILSERV